MINRKEQMEYIISAIVIIILFIDTIAVFVAGYIAIGVISVIGLLAVGLLAVINSRS